MHTEIRLFTARASRVACALFCSIAIAFASGQATAGTLEIFFTDFDIELTPDAGGMTGTLTDGGGTAGSDALFSASFAADGSPIGSPITANANGGLFADLFVSGVPALTSGTPVSAPAGGTFRLTFPDEPLGDDKFLDLTLSDVVVAFIDATTVQFAFGASVASSVSEDLPLDLDIGSPVSLSFSTQIDSGLTSSSFGVIGFTANGTGEVRGDNAPDNQGGIPEPSSIALAGLFGLMGSVVAMRKRLG